MPAAALQAGVAALEAAHVTPLCLTIRRDGEWHFYKTIALPGHPNPGNAKGGFSHPMPIDARIHHRASSRVLGNLPPLPTGYAEAEALGREIGEALWPAAWTLWVESRDDDGTVVALDICRRITDTVALVSIMLAHGERAMLLAKKGGRP